MEAISLILVENMKSVDINISNEIIQKMDELRNPFRHMNMGV